MTLIIYVPSNEGLVVAADSRLSIGMGRFCDGVEKLVVPNRPRTLITVTGRRGFYPQAIYLQPDLCAPLKATRREFDFADIATEFVDGEGVPLEQLDMGKLAQACINRLTAYLTAHPEWLPTYTGERFASAINFACYDPKTKQAVLRGIEIKVPDDLRQITVRQYLNDRFGFDDISEPITAGEGDYVREHVLVRLKTMPLSATTLEILGGHPQYALRKVRDMGVAEARALAEDLISATSLMMQTIPSASGVGGITRSVLLGAEDHPITLQA
jgi:hypothetical protein